MQRFGCKGAGGRCHEDIWSGEWMDEYVNEGEDGQLAG